MTYGLPDRQRRSTGRFRAS